MTLEDGELITATDEPHTQLRHQHPTTDNYTWAIYVKYPHTPPTHLIQESANAFKKRLSADDTLNAFRKGWVYHSGHPDEDQAREQLRKISEEAAAEYYELMIADILINKGFAHSK
jgi:hypothetical protein